MKPAPGQQLFSVVYLALPWSGLILGLRRANERRRYFMMTSSNGNIFRVTGPLCGEFTGPGEFPTQRPVTRTFDVFFDLRLNKRLSKQPWGWWFEKPSWSLWHHCNVCKPYVMHGGGVISSVTLYNYYVDIFNFRCVLSTHRTVAIGLQGMLSKLIGKL